MRIPGIATLVIAALLLGAGCSSGRSHAKPRASCEPECLETAPRTIPAATIDDAWRESLASIGARIESGELEPGRPLADVRRPRVVFYRCPWIVARPAPMPGDPNPGPTCAAGATEPNASVVYVSTWDEPRVVPLLLWEFTNSIFIQIGRRELAY